MDRLTDQRRGADEASRVSARPERQTSGVEERSAKETLGGRKHFEGQEQDPPQVGQSSRGGVVRREGDDRASAATAPQGPGREAEDRGGSEQNLTPFHLYLLPKYNEYIFTISFKNINLLQIKRINRKWLLLFLKNLYTACIKNIIRLPSCVINGGSERKLQERRGSCNFRIRVLGRIYSLVSCTPDVVLMLLELNLIV